jgi:hypothetical protein
LNKYRETHGDFTYILVTSSFCARKTKWAGLVAPLVGKPEGRRQLGRVKRRWVDNIKMDLKEIAMG